MRKALISLWDVVSSIWIKCAMSGLSRSCLSLSGCWFIQSCLCTVSVLKPVRVSLYTLSWPCLVSPYTQPPSQGHTSTVLLADASGKMVDLMNENAIHCANSSLTSVTLTSHYTWPVQNFIPDHHTIYDQFSWISDDCPSPILSCISSVSFEIAAGFT